MSSTDRRRSLVERARSRSGENLLRSRHSIDVRHRTARAHLTVPAPIWKYVEKACTSAAVDLVMLDLEDSIPRDDVQSLESGRANIVRALRELDWGSKLRFMRPRGTQLDPGHEDLITVGADAIDQLEGIVIPKVEHPGEVRSIDATLTDLERFGSGPTERVRIHVLIESIEGEERAFEIAASSSRVSALVFGAYDWWSSLGMREPYRFDHPLVDQARGRIVRAAASVGIPAVAEMTTNFPTSDKTDEDRLAALDELRRDAAHARTLGFRGKWIGVPTQADAVRATFRIDSSRVARAVEDVRAFREIERGGRGAAMVGGRMVDRATDRVARTLLEDALAHGVLDPGVAEDLRIERKER